MKNVLLHVRMHVLPRPLPTSSDPGTDIAIGYAWRAAVLLTALFLALRLAGVTSWQWWAVLMPAEVIAGLFVAGVMIAFGGLLLWAIMGDG